MTKKGISLYYIILLVFCQVLGVCGSDVMAITETQRNAIIERCDSIKDDLKEVQKRDARTRVYLGGYYETILSKFIMPLNVRLVENNLSSAGFVENQNIFAETKALFSDDFISYQQNLEELVGIDCKKEPERFYDKLIVVQKKRKIMTQDVTKMRELIAGHVRLVEGVKDKI